MTLLRGLMSTAAAVMILSLSTALAQPERQLDELRLSFPTHDRNLTPYTFTVGYYLMTLVYDTLMWRDPNGIPRPWLARSVATSGDGMTVTIELHDDVRFHDGEPLTSKDVAFTFDYIQRRFHPRFTPQVADIASIETPDANTVTMRLRRPSAGFVDQPLADVPILPAHLWRAVPAGRLAPKGLPVGSGPYRLVAHPKTGYRFKADDDYHLGRPTVRTLKVKVIRTLDDTVTALRRRRIDAIPVRLTPDQLVRGSEVAIARVGGASYSGTALLFNTRRPPFDRAEARRAVAAALDLKRLAGGVGFAVPADHGYLHPGSRWAPARALHRFRPEAARRGLAELGRIEILAPDNDPPAHEAGRQVVLALRRAGATAKLTSLSPAEHASALGLHGSAPDFTAAIGQIPSLVSYDPAFLTAVLGSDPASASVNHTGYASAAFERAARRVARTRALADRREAVAAELRVLARDVPAVPLMFPNAVYAYRDFIYDDWVFVQGNGILDKQSFLPHHGMSHGPLGDPERRNAAPLPPEETFGILEITALSLLAIGVVLIAVGALRRRPRRAGRAL